MICVNIVWAPWRSIMIGLGPWHPHLIVPWAHYFTPSLYWTYWVIKLKIKFDAIEIRDCYISQHQNDNQLIYISSASSHLFQEQERAPKPWLDETLHLKDNIQVHCKHIQHLHLHVTCTGQQGTTLKVPPVSASKCDRENPEEWSLTNHHLLGKLCNLGRELFWIW